jgi:hypothetical protein
MVPEFVNKIINTIFSLFFSGLDMFFKRFGTWLTTLPWFVLIGLLLISMLGADQLAPLLAYLIIFFVLLLLLQTIVLPFFRSMPMNNPLANIFESLKFVILRLAFYGTLLLGVLWSLNILGLLENFLSLLDSLPSLTIPTVDVVLPGVIILLVLTFFFIILRPAFARS